MKIKSKILLGILLLCSFALKNLSAQDASQNWFHMDPKTDKTFGVSDDKAYNTILQGKQSTTVIVAVIDGGTDFDHPDLKDHIWTNPKEIAGNGIDDDHNGYIDDVHGWDFIGGKNGSVQYDNFELTRLYKTLKARFGSSDAGKISAADQKDYDLYKNLKSDYETESASSTMNYTMYSGIMSGLEAALKDMGKENPTAAEVEAYTPSVDSLQKSKMIMQKIVEQGATVSEVIDQLKEGVQQVEADVKYHYNLDYDPRSIVGDNYLDGTERNYGNNDLKGADPMHGTHVAGIIGAVRNNNVGMNGICNNVKIMVVRVVPDGDERDKDVANGIRYAVDNGAKVINMSFGKGYSFNKKLVDDAVRYAESKDVLLVHGSGNDSKNVDDDNTVPNDKFEDGTHATNWINVGANQPTNASADFSNWGHEQVDIFAPGTEIYSTVPDGKYRNLQGTSMASPVVAGVAALVRSYYPNLTAPQVKDILMKSVTKMKGKVIEPGTENTKVKWTVLCVSGGVVNAYNALVLAGKTVAQ